MALDAVVVIGIGTHADLGPVHLQVNDGSTAVGHQPAEFLDTHPLDVVERRFESLRKAVVAVEWGTDGRRGSHGNRRAVDGGGSRYGRLPDADNSELLDFHRR